MNNSVWIYILVMAAVSYLLRVLPLTLIRKPIENHFMRSLFFYMPYVTLSVMTVPAIFAISDNIFCGIAALISAAVVAWFSSNLFFSAVAACLAVYIVGLL